ncbi:aerolysin-like protein [Myxocyprinus asiaticus]|uniref:aerolysin-like protein n=1 Tax=Myxocyprinus asiaticus TaxID=70543 RepID=UPI002221E20B|nr:aerolysin-like protein [Myxocyprinus asiaticus]
MSDNLVVAGFGPLQAYIGAEEGVALQADNGRFLSCVYQRSNIYNIEAAKTTKDSWCKFIVEKVDDSKVRLKDQRGVYLSRIHRSGVDHIEAAKAKSDEFCEFSVFTRNGKVIFRADNGLFLSRCFRGNQNIEAVKDGVDECCEFSLSIGDIISPVFEIVNIDFGKIPDLSDKPSMVKSDYYINESSVNQSHTFKLNWMDTVTETTTWTHTWGLSTTVSFGFLLLSAEVTISYSGQYGTSSSKEKTISMSEETAITIPPKTKITVKLMVNKDDHAEIPFTATIKKTKANGQVEMFTENGIWKGVVYENVRLKIEEAKV